MKIIKVKDYKEMSKKAAEIIIKQIQKKPNSVICFPTGRTPIGMYKLLVYAYKKNQVNFSKVKAFNLDEYYPIKKKSQDSYYFYMFKHLFNKVNIKKSNINLLDGNTKNAKKECENYEEKIKKNKIDLQILGIGVNGHIGFNEPGSGINSKTRIVNLTADTIKQNSVLFKNKKSMPHKAMTMGIKTIASAKKIILLASRKKKAEAIKHLIKGKPNKEWPASLLKNHKDFTVIVDKKAIG